MKIEAGRADVNAMMVKVAQQIADDRAAHRKRIASGDVRDSTFEQRDNIAVVQQPAPPRADDPLHEPRVRWCSVAMPYGLPQITVEGSAGEAARNGWDMRVLLTRRFHRSYRNALVSGRVMSQDAAAKHAKRAEIYVAELGLAP